MKIRFRYIYIAMVMLSISAMLIWFQHSGETNEKSVMSEIENAVCAKFESHDTVVYITSEMRIISTTFSSLDLVESGGEVSEWLWKITFNCNEIAPDSKEIIVEIGQTAISINGVVYTTPNDVPFEKILDIIRAKFEYFNS